MSKQRPARVLSSIILLVSFTAWSFGKPGLSVAAAPNELRVCNTSPGFYPTIQAAVDAAQPGDTVKVAAGTYTESKVVGAFQNNLLMTKTIQLMGGYTCADWTNRSAAANLTRIQPANPDFSVVNIAGAIGQPDQVAPLLDGFDITGETAPGGGNHGGGLRVTNSNAIIRDNHIHDNTGYLYGGGIWVQNGSPRFENNLVEKNVVKNGGVDAGGGIELEGTQAVLGGNIITGNRVDDPAGYGGGVAVVGGGMVFLDGNTITGNAAASKAGGPTDFGYGGGLSVQGAPVTLTGNLIQNNLANSAGDLTTTTAFGAGGGVYLFNSSGFILMDNTIDSNATAFGFSNQNRTLYGGGLLIDTSQGTLTGNLITGNKANRYKIFGNGGGLAALSSTLTVQGGRITGNQTALNYEGYGGGLYLKDSTLTLDSTWIGNNSAGNTPAYGLGGGLAAINSHYTITNAVFKANYAYNNNTGVGGLWADSTSSGTIINSTFDSNLGQGIRSASPLTMTNDIVAGHKTGINITAAVTVHITYNDLWNNTTDAAGFPVDPSNLFFNPLLDATEHLAVNSPVIDAGTHSGAPAVDFDGQPRPMAGPAGQFGVDIGADEYPGAAQHILNLDRAPADLTLIGPGNPAENPNSNGPNDYIGYSVLGADVNGDGQADLVTAAEDWAEDFDNPPYATGRQFGLFNNGARRTGVIDFLNDPPSLVVRSRLLLQHTGAALVSGDLNHDGHGDLIFGSYEDDGAGGGKVIPTVFALWGGPTLAGTLTLNTPEDASFRLRAPGTDFLSFSAKNALAVADLSGDGQADLIVGDGLANDGGAAGAGAVFVIFGGPTLGGLHDLAVTPADFTLYGPAAAAKLWRLAVGHVNSGPGLDLVARTDTTAYVLLGPLSSGAVHLSSTPANIKITGLQPGGVAVMDLTGDGIDDIILGSGDKLFVIPGPLSDGQVLDAAASAGLTLTGAPVEAFATGNVAGDGRPDLIVGVPSLKRAYVLTGGLPLTGTMPIENAAQTLVMGSASQLGKDVAAGDLDGDGRADLIVGSYRVDVATHPAKFQDAGKVFVFYSPVVRLFLPYVKQ